MPLIDTEKAWKTAQRIYSDPVLLHAIKNVLDSTEAIEAAPVVHGRWKYVEVIGFGLLSTCSECGHHDHETNYCPNCGARMDGDGNA